MNAKDLASRYSMDAHVENGLFIENHYEKSEENLPAYNPDRAASGSIYYYVAPGELTEFHRIDCDEYWVYNEGSDIDLWVISTDGSLWVKRLGIGPGAEPCIRIAAGEIFASKLPGDAADGTFLTCITVPRFTYEGFEMIDKDSVLQIQPMCREFW